MSKQAKYESIYQQKRHALGEPFLEYVAFFEAYDQQNADVLDVGCGQGRDALFIARQGHHVVGIDIAETGIAQLLEDARGEGLNIEGFVSDLCDFEPVGGFDVAVIDRTLHMISNVHVRLGILARIGDAVRPGGYVLIADERSNLPAMHDYFAQDSTHWLTVLDKKGFLFVQKG